MLQNIIYAITRTIIRFGLRIFFHEIQVRNKERIPQNDPFIVTSNHPNDKLDALVLGRTVPKRINFLAAGFLFKNKILGWIMRSTGTIPVYRKHENEDAEERNVDSFTACFDVLKNKGAIGVFPEGLTHLDRQVKKVKTGTARIAIEAEVRNNWQLGLKIVPVGLNYYHPTKIRGKIFINFGRPISVADYKDEYEQDSEKAIHNFTDLIYSKIQEHVIHLDSENLQQLLGDLEHIYKGHLLEQLSEEEPVSEFMLSKKLAEAAQYYYEHDPGKIAEVWGKLENYKRKLKEMGVGDTMIREYHHRGVMQRGLGAFLITIVGVPIALYGWLNSLPAIILTMIFSQRKANRLTKIALTKLTSGLLIFPVVFIIQIVIFSNYYNSNLTALYAISLPITCYFALFFRDKYKAFKRDIYQAYAHFTKRSLIFILKKERLQLIRYLNQIKDEYLTIMNQKD
jgi:1-acyl-sn-glycerol-3-phosphate acyltransferase